MTLQPIEGKSLTIYQPSGLTSTCQWTDVEGHPASLRVTCSHYVESSTVIVFLDRNYRYKSVATQIPHNYGLEPILYT